MDLCDWWGFEGSKKQHSPPWSKAGGCIETSPLFHTDTHILKSQWVGFPSHVLTQEASYGEVNINEILQHRGHRGPWDTLQKLMLFLKGVHSPAYKKETLLFKCHRIVTKSGQKTQPEKGKHNTVLRNINRILNQRKRAEREQLEISGKLCSWSLWVSPHFQGKQFLSSSEIGADTNYRKEKVVQIPQIKIFVKYNNC